MPNGPRRILVVTSKPAISAAVVPHIAERFPDADVHDHPLLRIGHLGFAVPRGLSWSDFPWVGEPRYAKDGFAPYFGVWDRGRRRPAYRRTDLGHEPYLAALRGFDGYVFAGDPCHTEAGAFAIAMRAAGVPGPWPWCRYVA